jgi:hypothetical protein
MTTIIERMVKIAAIEDDVELCMRVNGLNPETVKEYAAAMKAGAEFPPVELTQVGSLLMLTNGFHRRAAALKLGETEILARIVEGTEVEAKLAAAGADSHDGLRRTNADKRKAVMLMLSTPEIADKFNDQKIANLAGVHRDTVHDLRKKNSVVGNRQLNSPNPGVPAPAPKSKRGKDGKKYPTTKNKPKPSVNKPPPATNVVALTPKPTAGLGGHITAEQREKAEAHGYRHVYLHPIETEILHNNQKAARAFSGAVSALGEAAQAFLTRVQKEGSCERYGEKGKESPFTPKEYFDTLATMENGGQLWHRKLTQRLDDLLIALRLIEQFVEPAKRNSEEG